MKMKMGEAVALTIPVFQFQHFRIKLETYDSKTRTTTLPTTTMSEADLEWEFIQSGPTNLLEAVYCDPCKAKVIDTQVAKKYPCFIA